MCFGRLSLGKDGNSGSVIRDPEDADEEVSSTENEKEANVICNDEADALDHDSEIELDELDELNEDDGKITRESHPLLDTRPCDENGKFLPADSPPPPQSNEPDKDNFEPFDDRIHFETADFLYTHNQMSAGDIDFLGHLWAATLLKHKISPPFADHTELYETIDSIKAGDVRWQSRNMKYTGPIADPDSAPKWQTQGYDIWFRDMRQVMRNLLSNPEFDGEFDYTPIDFMSGDWAWGEASTIAGENPGTIGSMLVPIILRSDKTTVSVATGQNEYHPVYASIGNVHNNVRRAHRNAMVVIGFLAIPKVQLILASATKDMEDDAAFRKFKRQLMHTSLSMMLCSLKTNMSKPVVVRCPDGRFQRAVFTIGPYIADYPEQVLLTCINQGWCPRCKAKRLDLENDAKPRSREWLNAMTASLPTGTLRKKHSIVKDAIPFTNDFPRADIHDLISPEILHQLIKGTFKDHLVSWVEEYLNKTHRKAQAAHIMADIDWRPGSCFGVNVATLHQAASGMSKQDTPKTRDDLAREEHEKEDQGDVPGARVQDRVDMANMRQRHYSRNVEDLVEHIREPRLPELISQYIYGHTTPNPLPDSQVPKEDLPSFRENVFVHHSAAATYFAPSNPSGTGGMHREHIRATPSWYRGPSQFDCVYLKRDVSQPGLAGLDVARGRDINAPSFIDTKWLTPRLTRRRGMWIVKPDTGPGGRQNLGVVPIRSILRAAHLMPRFGRSAVSREVTAYNSLDAYKRFYVNRYIDHHAFEVIC
ncbi:hypothetical protein CERSUDRAFT_78076 [Gelatoporia subvermispora B]|uniref:Uncharacterized protein n=1 Tax=Ceriporiopsis subvermispora (strain B) TaxID=914234 RepID=M2QYL8_CERS8|nr:hypothetical protein CERSUDRAFT_78076 [Gelatoporia subvermispora B]